jgi:glycosyltransferase involved in cell wall biosynthesis
LAGEIHLVKTLHLTNAFHPTSGGISTFYRALFAAASRMGRPMHLVVPAAETRTERVGECVQIHHVQGPASPVFDQRYRILPPTSYLPPWHGAIQRILEREQPDLVEVCDKYTISWLAGLLRRGWIRGVRRPVLVGLTCERMDDNLGAYLTRHPWSQTVARRYLGHLYLPLFDYHIANSEYTAAELREAMLAGHQRPVEVLPMGAEIGEFLGASPSSAARQALRKEVGGTDRTRLLLYAGRLSPEKNIPLLPDLLEALAREGLEDYRLLVAGSGPLAGWLGEEAARRAPGKLVQLGHLTDRKRLIDLYLHSDIFVHPNPREPFGIAPLEAMAAGLPLLAPRAGGVLSYAHEGNSWLREPTGPAFAEGVLEILRDEMGRKEKLSQARWTAQQFGWENVSQQFFASYDRMVDQFPTTRFAVAASSLATREPARRAGG